MLIVCCCITDIDLITPDQLGVNVAQDPMFVIGSYPHSVVVVARLDGGVTLGVYTDHYPHMSQGPVAAPAEYCYAARLWAALGKL
jgi:hypothetical protein